MGKLVFLFLIAALFFSCQKELYQENFVNIGTRIEVSLAQNVDDKGPFMEVVLSAKDSISCKNAILINSTSQNLNVVNVNIEGIGLDQNEPCEIGKSKPHFSERINTNLPSYLIAVNLKTSISNVGKIFNDANKSSISFESSEGLIPGDLTLNKIKDNTAWGIIHTNDLEKIEALKKVISKFSDGNFIPELGNYHLFQYNGVNDINITDPLFPNPIKTYKFAFYVKYSDWQALNKEIESFKKLNPSDSIFIRNDKGKI